LTIQRRRRSLQPVPFLIGTISMRMMALSLILAASVLTGSAFAQSNSEKPLAKRASDPSLSWGPCPPIFPGNCAIAVLNGDPAKPNADIFLRVGPGYKLPRHRHTSAERMILVSGRLRVHYEGSKPSTLDPGSYAFGPAKLAHDVLCISKTACTLFIAFEGPVDALSAPTG